MQKKRKPLEKRRFHPTEDPYIAPFGRTTDSAVNVRVFFNNVKGENLCGIGASLLREYSFEHPVTEGHLKYCLDCQDKWIAFKGEIVAARESQLLLQLSERTSLESRIFADNEILFLDAYSENRVPWRNNRMIKFFNCRSAKELLFIFRHWKRWYERIYGPLRVEGHFDPSLLGPHGEIE